MIILRKQFSKKDKRKKNLSDTEELGIVGGTALAAGSIPTAIDYIKNGKNIKKSLISGFNENSFEGTREVVSKHMSPGKLELTPEVNEAIKRQDLIRKRLEELKENPKKALKNLTKEEKKFLRGGKVLKEAAGRNIGKSLVGAGIGAGVGYTALRLKDKKK